ncbi:hypothetical protein [Mumia sp. DW29H23]|uniref:hypothetical protein n=1 Tax=Mumia sp. DW29H23 TaxID=3421241 RepID=UPI003D68274D
MRARRIPVLLLLLALLGAYAGTWSTASAADEVGLTATVSPGSGAPGSQITVKGAGWPAMTQVQAVVCGDLAIGGSAACDQTSAILGVANVDGEIDLDMTVGNPPRPCPCVVRVASYTGPALAVDTPFVVTGHAVGTPPSAALPLPSLRVTDVKLEGGGGIGALFGFTPTRRLVFTIENQGNAPAVNPEVLIGVGQSEKTEPTVTTSRDLTIEPLQSATMEMDVSLPFAAFGTYHVVGQVGEGELGTTFSTEWATYPWALVAGCVLGVFLIGWGLRRRLDARRDRPEVDRERAAALTSRPYALPDVVYVEAIGGFLVSPKAVGRSGLIRRLDGRLEQRDLEALLHDPALAVGTAVLSDLPAEAGGGAGASVVDLVALDTWLARRSPGAATGSGSGGPSGGPDGSGASAVADSVVDVEAVDAWLRRRDGKRSSHAN